MKAYSLSANERAMSDFTDVFVLEAADLSAFATTAVVLTALAIGDVVRQVVMEELTTIAGPTGTPTASVGVVGAVTQFVGATSVVGAAPVYTASTASPYAAASALNMVVNLAAGGGNGAAATAGKLVIWANISRAGDRAVRG